MNEVLGAVLGIKLSLQGMQAVVAGIQKVREELGLTKAQADTAIQGFKALAAEAAFVGAALFKAGEDESMRLALQGATQDAALAGRQIAFVRTESEKGLFDKDEIFKTVKLFDLAHESLSRFLPLTEAIALRSGKGLTETARYITELAGGGTARLMGLLKPAGITVEQLRGAGLNVTDHYQTKNSAEQILKALEKITSSDGITNLLGGGFMAAYKGDLADVADLLRSIGDGLLPIATPVLQFLGGLIKTITLLNDLTGGWASNVLLAVGAFMAIQKVLPLMQALINWQKIGVFWAAIWDTLNGGWLKWPGMIREFITVMKELITVEKIAAAWQAVLDALEGNWVGLATGAAVAAAVGVGWHFANQDKGADSSIDPQTNSGGDRAQRRSSWERVFQDRHGSWMGA